MTFITLPEVGFTLYYQLPGAFAKSQQSLGNSLIAALIQLFYQAVFTECLDIPIRKTLCVEFGSRPPVPGQIGKPFRGSAGGLFRVVGGVVRTHIGVNIDVAAPIVIVAIVAAVLISNFVKAQQEEAARLDAYNAAVALAEAGQYEEAIAAFTELGDYKDSATLAAQAQEEAEEAARLEAYNAAVALAEAGQYDEAIAAFEELGDYKDSTELISSAKLEKKYIEALTLLENRDFEAARATFEALGDYKDATGHISVSHKFVSFFLLKYFKNKQYPIDIFRPLW